MNPLQYISIPNPCTAAWNEMAPVNNGRHCNSCCKTVVDFSLMTDTEVIGHIATSGNACGRFDQFQLNRINHLLAPEFSSTFRWKGFVAAASMIGLLPSVSVEAKTPCKVQQEIMVADSSIMVKIKSKVTDKENGLPLPGVSIIVKGTSIGTQTAPDGSFKLSLFSTNGLLVISSVGYKPVEIPVTQMGHQQDINLEMETTMLDVVAINKTNVFKKTCIMGDIRAVSSKKIPFYLRWWYWLRHQFHHIISAITPSFNE